MQLNYFDQLFPGCSEMRRFTYPVRPLRKRISVSFSAGASSGYMLGLLAEFQQLEPLREIVFTFCNTGLEHEETLVFADQCARHFNVPIVWLEAVVTHGERTGIRHRVVTFKTASRNGEPFEEYIKKHGIPNPAFPQCNSRLKLDVMESYRRSIGWEAGSYSTAIGIRSDEADRISIDGMNYGGLFYPLTDAKVKSLDVKEWWLNQPFRLNLPAHRGNCKTCWKKSDRKLMTIARETPEDFDFMDRMERLYGWTGGPRRDGQAQTEVRTFFRNNRTALDIIEACKRPFVPFVDGRFIPFDDHLDVGGGCGDSCEIGADETDAIMDENWNPNNNLQISKNND